MGEFMFRDRVVRAARISSGVGLMALGIAMLVLPGPGILSIAAGLALLQRDVPFAARLAERLRAWRFGPPLTTAPARVPVPRD